MRPPDPLLAKVEYANRQSGKHERLVILQVRLLSRLLNQNDRVVQRLRRLRDKQETDGSIPSAITDLTSLRDLANTVEQPICLRESAGSN